MTAKFWVLGTGTWDASTMTNWSLSSGGAGGAAVPVTGDSVTFDASSGGGTVTVAAAISGLSLANITSSAFTGTIDFSVGNPSLTITSSWTDAGTGAHTVKLGSGTFTLSAASSNAWNFSGASTTLTAGTSTLLFNGTTNGNINFVSGGLTYNNVTFSPNYTAGHGESVQITGNGTAANLTLTAPCNAIFTGSFTISTTFTANGTSSNMVGILNTGTQRSLTVPVGSTISWAAINGYNFVNGPTATNSFNLGGNSNITINAPSGGGSSGGAIIGS